MKTIFKALLAVCCTILSTSPAYALDYDFTDGNLCYKFNADGKTVSVTYQNSYGSHYSNLSGTVDIPENVTYNGVQYIVTEIGSSAFEGCKSITGVTIPNSITAIGYRAFYECSTLKDVSIANSVTTIGECAFYACTSLTSIAIPDMVNTIGYSAFDSCSKLANVTIGNSVTFIGYDAFRSTLWYNNQDNGVVYLGNWIYRYKGTMPTGTEIVVKEGTKGIAEQAFKGYTGLNSITLPNSIRCIDDQAFYNCSKLQNVVLDATLDYLGSEVFYGVPWIWNQHPKGECYIGNWLYGYIGTMPSGTTLVIKDGTIGIAGTALKKTSTLTGVVIPNSVTTIGNSAFYNCSHLTSATIGNSVTKIGSAAFSGCIALSNLIVNEGNPKYDSREGCNALIETATNTLILGSLKTVVPNSVTAIADNAFVGYRMERFTMPNSVTSIGINAFTYGMDDFEFTELTITGNGPWQLSDIGGLSLPSTINFGSGITSLGDCQLKSWGKISCYAATPPVCTDKTFYEGYSGELHVPSTSTAAYFTAPYWENFSNIQYDLTQVVELDRSEASLSQWDELQLTVTKKPSGDIRWSSGDISVATVDGNGKVTAVGGGECDIFASAASNLAVYTSCHVTVNYPEVTLTLDKNNLNINQIGEQVTLVATITPGNTGLKPTWSSSALEVATVDANGAVTSVGKGECDITATVLDKSATCHVKVAYSDVTLTLDKENVTIDKVGEQVRLLATISPNDTGLTPTWSSSASNVAIVDTDGVVTAMGRGECDIIASVQDKTAMCHVTVNGTITIIVDPKTANIKPNTILTLSPMFDHEPTSIVVTSSDPAIAAARVVNKKSAPVLAPVAGTQQVQVVGVANGVATITIASVDGKAIPATCEVTVSEFFIGDVDGNDVVNGSDVTALYNCLLNDVQPQGNADVDGNGVVNGSDVTALYNILLSK